MKWFAFYIWWLACVALRIQGSPAPPQLQLLQTSQRQGTSEYMERSLLQATCHVTASLLPPLNITWYMGDDVIREGLGSALYAEDTVMSVHSLSQDVTRYVTWRDDDVDLACVGGDVTSLTSTRTAVRIRVKYTPRFPEEHVSPRLPLGKPGTISVRLSANPRPGITWMFGDNVILREGSTDPEGRIFAAPTVDQGGGWWLSELRVERMRAEDLGLYMMLARNEAGVATYHVFVRDQSKYPGTGGGSQMSRFPIAYVASLVIACSIVASMLLIFTLMACEAFRPQGNKPPSYTPQGVAGLAEPIQMTMIRVTSTNVTAGPSGLYQAVPTTEQEMSLGSMTSGPSGLYQAVPTTEQETSPGSAQPTPSPRRQGGLQKPVEGCGSTTVGSVNDELESSVTPTSSQQSTASLSSLIEQRDIGAAIV